MAPPFFYQSDINKVKKYFNVDVTELDQETKNKIHIVINSLAFNELVENQMISLQDIQRYSLKFN